MDKPFDIPDFLKDPQIVSELADEDVCKFCWCRVQYAGASIQSDEFLCRCGDGEEDCYD